MYEPILTVDVTELASSINGIWVLTVSFLIFFMQPGFVLLESGQVRSKNVANVAMKNMFDWSLGVLAFFLVGLGIANVVGYLTSSAELSLAASFNYINAPGEWIGWFFGAVFAMTAATIVSGAVAERIKFKAYVIYSVVLTMLIYPVVVGLTWQGGLLSEAGYLGQFLDTGYLDFAGGTVVHMVGGVAGLTAAYIVGAREDRYDEDGSSNPIPGHSVLFAVLGTLFLAFGWFGFNVGTQATVLTNDGAFLGDELGRAVLVTTLGMAAGAVASSIVTTIYQGKPDPLFTANGLLAGLVAVTGGAAYVTWWGGLALGAVGGALVYPTFRWTTDTLKIDDVCGVFAVHGMAGAVGVLLIPFVGVAGGGWAFLGIEQVAMQFVGVSIIVAWTVAATVGTFVVLQSMMAIRVDSEFEESGLDQSEHNIIAYPQFVTDGGTTASAGTSRPTASSQGTQEADEPTMWRGEEVGSGRSAVLDGAGIDAFPEPTVIVDTEDVITALNPPALRFFETVQEVAIDSRPTQLVDSSENSLSAISEAVRTGKEVRDRKGTITIGGDSTPVAVTAKPLHEEETVVGAIATIRNIAEEVSINRHRQTLEEYRNANIRSQQEKLATLADGDLDVEPGVPEPPNEHPDFEGLHDLFQTIDNHVIEVTNNIAAIVEKLPGQSEELARSSTDLSTSSTEVQASVEEVSDLSTEIDRRVETLSSQTADASHSVSDLSAAIEEITASTSEIAAQSTEATTITKEAVEEMVRTVDHIREAANRTTEASGAIDELEDDMQSVSEITSIIQDIAEQTNMLAINASIEAVQANGDGDGFAVVAEEVKSLAEETKAAADDIDDIISTAQGQTETVAETISETTDKISTGADSVEKSAENLKTAKERIEATNSGINEISQAVDEQATNTERVSAAMVEVEEGTDTISDLTTDISEQVDTEREEMKRVTDLAEQLRNLATKMHSNIDKYELDASLGASTELN